MEGQGSEGNVGEGTKQDTPKQQQSSSYLPPSDYKPGYTGAPPQQYPMAPGPGMSTFVGRFRRTDKVVQMVVLGIILMFIGGIMIAIITTGEGPKPYDEKYDEDDDGSIDDADKREEFYEDWRLYNAINYVGKIIGRILINFGMLLAVLALLVGGIVNDQIDRYVRIGMIIAAGLILGWSVLG